MRRQYCVYILTNSGNTVLYTGVTSDLKKRVWQHRKKLVPGFTQRYNVYKLVFYEVTDDVHAAIAREKQIKAGTRQRKIDLIQAMNSESRDVRTPVEDRSCFSKSTARRFFGSANEIATSLCSSQ